MICQSYRSFILSGASPSHTGEHSGQRPHQRRCRTGKRQSEGSRGKITGDSKLEGEGKADQVNGKIQNAIGGIKDTLRGESPSNSKLEGEGKADQVNGKIQNAIGGIKDTLRGK